MQSNMVRIYRLCNPTWLRCEDCAIQHGEGVQIVQSNTRKVCRLCNPTRGRCVDCAIQHEEGVQIVQSNMVKVWHEPIIHQIPPIIFQLFIQTPPIILKCTPYYSAPMPSLDDVLCTVALSVKFPTCKESCL